MELSRDWLSQELPELDSELAGRLGLRFCAAPLGNTAIDLVTGVIGTRTGALTQSLRAHGGGFSAGADPLLTVAATGTTTDQIVWPASSTLRGGTAVQQGTLLCLGAITEQVATRIYYFGSSMNVDGSGMGLRISSGLTGVSGSVARSKSSATALATSTAALLGSTPGLKNHFFGYSYDSNGAAGTWFGARGGEDWTGGTVFGTGNTNRKALLFSDYDTGTYSTKATAVGLFLIFDKRLTVEQYQSLYDEPRQLFKPLRVWVPVSAAAGGSTTINAGVGAAVAAGHPASVVLTTSIAAGVGAGVAAGHPALLALHTSIAAGVASAAAAGHPAQLALHTTVAAGVGAAVAAGHPATINVQTGTTINAGVGAAVAAGHPATIQVYETTTINAGVGAATAAGHQATVAAHTVVAAGVGAASAAGHPAALALHTTVQAGMGAAVAAGHPASIVTAQATTINAGVGAATAQGHSATINVAGEVPQSQTTRGYRGNPRDLRDPWLDAAAEGQVRDKWDAIEKARKPAPPTDAPDDDTPAAEAAPIPTVPPAPPAAAAPVKAAGLPAAPTLPPASAAVLPEIPDAVEVLAAQTIERAKRQATEETLLVLLAMVV